VGRFEEPHLRKHRPVAGSHPIAVDATEIEDVGQGPVADAVIEKLVNSPLM